MAPSGIHIRTLARVLASLLLAALAVRCAGVKRNPADPVEPKFSCTTGGTVSCWNATRQVAGSGFNGEQICEWSCASYEGRTAALTLRLWPTCAGVIPIDRQCPWTCYVRAVEPRAACPGREPSRSSLPAAPDREVERGAQERDGRDAQDGARPEHQEQPGQASPQSAGEPSQPSSGEASQPEQPVDGDQAPETDGDQDQK
jgi:hypothetical protein